MEKQNIILENKRKEALMQKLGNFWAFFASADMSEAKRKNLAYQKFEVEYPGICISLNKKIMSKMKKKGENFSSIIDLLDFVDDFEDAFQKMSKYTENPDSLLT